MAGRAQECSSAAAATKTSARSTSAAGARRDAASASSRRLEYFDAGVVRLRGALDLADQQALVDCSLIAGFFHRTTPMDGAYTRAPGQPDIQIHWN